MMLPDFKNIPLTISAVALLKLESEIKKLLKSLANTYLELGGDKGNTTLQKPTIISLSQEIKNLIIENVYGTITKKRENNLFIKDFYPNNAVICDVSIYQNFKTSEIIPILHINIEVIHVIYFSFLKALKKDRPEIYPLLRQITALLSRISPHHDINDLFEWHIDITAENEETEKEIKEAMRQEVTEFKKYTKINKSYNALLRNIKKLHKKNYCHMTDMENLFVKTAIKLFDLVNNKYKIELFEDAYDEEDCNMIQDFFNILWYPDGHISEWRDSDFYNYNDLSSPGLKIKITDKKSLKNAMKEIQYFILLSSIFCGGYDLWDTRK